MTAPPRDRITLQLAGETVLLLAQKALYWPARKTLMVADIHFGKAAAFRAAGVPVPQGTTTQNLAALDALMVLHAVEHIVFLGDFLHARAAHAASTMAALLAWRARHGACRLTLVRGNHDAHAGDPPPALGMAMVDEPFACGPFLLCHHPDLADSASESDSDRAGAAYRLAGHVHPVYRLAAGRDALRLPCFLVGPGALVLPSFGAFTGGHAVRPAPHERLFLVAGDALLELAPRDAASAGTAV